MFLDEHGKKKVIFLFMGQGRQIVLSTASVVINLMIDELSCFTSRTQTFAKGGFLA